MKIIPKAKTSSRTSDSKLATAKPASSVAKLSTVAKSRKHNKPTKANPHAKTPPKNIARPPACLNFRPPPPYRIVGGDVI